MGEYVNGTVRPMVFNTKEIIIVNGKATNVSEPAENQSRLNDNFSKLPRSTPKDKSNNDDANANVNINDVKSSSNHMKDTTNNDDCNYTSEKGKNDNVHMKNETVIKSLSPLSRRKDKKTANVDENLLSVYQSMAYPDSSDRISPPIERMLPTLGNFRKGANHKLQFGTGRDGTKSNGGNGGNS